MRSAAGDGSRRKREKGKEKKAPAHHSALSHRETYELTGSMLFSDKHFKWRAFISGEYQTSEIKQRW